MNRAGEVIALCDRAIAALPDDGSYRRSRGVARALTADLAGAADDLQRHRQWAYDQVGYTDKHLEMLSDWIVTLKSGHNPFDAATLKALRRNPP